LLPLGFTDSDVWAIANLQNGVKSQQGTNLIKNQIPYKHLGSMWDHLPWFFNSRRERRMERAERSESLWKWQRILQ